MDTMSRSVAAILAVIGGALILAGIIVGLSPAYSESGAECGTGFSGSHSVLIGDAPCASVVADRRTLTWALIFPGMLIAAVGGYWHGQTAGTPGAQRQIAPSKYSKRVDTAIAPRERG